MSSETVLPNADTRLALPMKLSSRSRYVINDDSRLAAILSVYTYCPRPLQPAPKEMAQA
jgi:hypothetical protein